ncbi:McrB family protein [Microbacterium sp. Root280D1]|uniref:McrB family protein n=1 Tax=Microbacterium sp. Root280D1 TaxID=1736510 RepID=UPI0006F8955E|nr:AAA family ATPase [Microbacterium sp. Root280D1]KRD53730.1 hypothetical protein ASE34_01085 [Microbacterium sp. Root280D1]
MELALETIRVVSRFKNVVLEGPPGTGKSHVVAEIARRWTEQTGRTLKGDGRGAYAITMHPSTTYEEFIDGLRYDETAQSFVRKDGFMRRIATEAKAAPDKDFLILLDELNRANVPKVFGDLLLTMEASKRASWDPATGDWSGGMIVTLPYSGDQFSLPSNVYLLGTMNSTDRSIAPLDSALRRRFGFIRVQPLGGTALRDRLRAVEGEDSAARAARSIDQLTNLNAALRECLGPDAMLGHSYLFGMSPTVGLLADVPDPLAELRAAASSGQIKGAFWVESRKLDGGSFNQLGLPDEAPPQREHGILSSFYPMSSQGKVTARQSPKGERDNVDITYAGKTYLSNVVRWNKDGPNFKLYLSGATSAGEKMTAVTKDHLFDFKIHTFLRRADHTLELVLLDLDAKAALVAVSAWHEESNTSALRRSYGEIDLDELKKSTEARTDTDADAELTIWRYAILPQLIDTLTQVGATELLDEDARVRWLAETGNEDVADRWALFDDFLEDLSLAVREEGFGLTRGLAVTELTATAPTHEDLDTQGASPSDDD